METEKNGGESYKSFRLFMMSILGRTEGTAESYVSYVKGVCKIVGKAADEIVSSVDDMSSAIAQIENVRKSEGTKRNYVSGIKAYWRYFNGCEYEKDSVSIVRDRVDVAFDVRKEVNELELRACDSDASFWSRIMDVAILVLTVIPTLLTLSGVKPLVMWVLASAMLLGALGLVAMIPILRRPIRQNTELYTYGKKVMAGSASGFEFTPDEKTFLEKWCERLVMILLPLSVIIIFAAILLSANAELT